MHVKISFVERGKTGLKSVIKSSFFQYAKMFVNSDSGLSTPKMRKIDTGTIYRGAAQ
jgi:hypothetical protein